LIQIHTRMQKGLADSPGAIPLNCVDKCLLALHDINEPMLIHVILNLEGEVDPGRLSEAISRAQQAHPVMRTLLRSRNLRLYREIQGELDKGILTVKDGLHRDDRNHEDCLSSWMNQPLDLKKDFPVRVLLLRRYQAEQLLVFTFHHSSADGLRALLFVRTVVEGYNRGLGKEGEANAWPAQDTGDIRTGRRGDELLQFAHSQGSKVKRYYWSVISDLVRRFILGAFLPPTRVFHDRSGQSRELRFCYAVMSQGELEQTQSKANRAGVTLNDLLLAACYGAVEQWNSRHGQASRRIRIMAPVNISPKGFRNVVSNQASWLSLPTLPEDRVDARRLLRKVRGDTISATMNRTAFSLVYFFYFCSRFPVFVMRAMCRFLITTRTYVDTILVTNVGYIWPRPGSEEAALTSMGDARILNVTGSAPVVSPMGLSIAAGTYKKQLNLSLTYRPALFSHDKAQAFLALYLEAIKNYELGEPGL
jgi:NRPS condensation-like uncharacterized protein